VWYQLKGSKCLVLVYVFIPLNCVDRNDNALVCVLAFGANSLKYNLSLYARKSDCYYVLRFLIMLFNGVQKFRHCDE